MTSSSKPVMINSFFLSYLSLSSAFLTTTSPQSTLRQDHRLTDFQERTEHQKEGISHNSQFLSIPTSTAQLPRSSTRILLDLFADRAVILQLPRPRGRHFCRHFSNVKYVPVLIFGYFRAPGLTFSGSGQVSAQAGLGFVGTKAGLAFVGGQADSLGFVIHLPCEEGQQRPFLFLLGLLFSAQ